MNPGQPRTTPRVTIVRRDGDPFEAESHEGAMAAELSTDVAILHKLFYDSTVDLGALVRIEDRTYVCTRAGWRLVPFPAER